MKQFEELCLPVAHLKLHTAKPNLLFRNLTLSLVRECSASHIRMPCAVNDRHNHIIYETLSPLLASKFQSALQFHYLQCLQNVHSLVVFVVVRQITSAGCAPVEWIASRTSRIQNQKVSELLVGLRSDVRSSRSAAPAVGLVGGLLEINSGRSGRRETLCRLRNSRKGSVDCASRTNSLYNESIDFVLIHCIANPCEQLVRSERPARNH